MAYLSEKEIIDKINILRKKLNAVILTHNYQLGEVQDIADFTGDSLELSMKAANTVADIIVFCGVKFMAETAYILSPEKKILLPVMESGCPMADMADADELRKVKAENPGAVVVCYVNSTAEVKAECDLCVTSANAVQIVSSIPADKKIIFVPDKNLGAYVQKKTGRNMFLWPGFCPTHMRITPEHILRKKAEYPNAVVMVHPESRPEVIELADEVLSTGGMCKFAKGTSKNTIIVATEMGIIYRLQKENPGKLFIPVSEQAICPNMKLTRLEDVLSALEKGRYEITVQENIRVLAKKPIERMLELSEKLMKN
ncbi:MAG: quinolinate synthase [Lentisphaerae bacterium GWF2_44_16]|nr:MAG: quinolinate synthase [Lentisphaerae bacterium GWF2_44_16]